MRSKSQMLPLTEWPEEDRNRWIAAFKAGDPFDDQGPGAHLADRTRRDLLYRYGCFLGFLKREYPDLLDFPPAERLTPNIIAQYFAFCRRSCSESTIADYLRTLRMVLRLICPTEDWSW